MKRGEVWWVDFDPSIGGEIQKERPAVIVSNDIANLLLNRVQVVPLTSNVDKLHRGQAYVMLNGQKHKAIADQINTVSKLRISNRIGRLSKSDMKEVENAVKYQLELS